MNDGLKDFQSMLGVRFSLDQEPMRNQQGNNVLNKNKLEEKQNEERASEQEVNESRKCLES